jgi:ABC-type transporter Mla subunit MlaD
MLTVFFYGAATADAVQALCEERGTSLSQANLQLEMLTEKVQLLTAELNQQEQDANELVRDLQQQLTTAQAKLQEYQAAEGMLDKAVLGAAAAGGLLSLLLQLADLCDGVHTTSCCSRRDAILRHC